MAKITVIPATINPLTRIPMMGVYKKKVCGYARVSTNHDEQFTSYEAQVDYYTNYITKNPEWDFVKVYTDEGISGTNTKHRDGFNEMIEDALAGKIDLIVTKSVSRFARNTVDSLVTIRKLKEKGVEVYFEKENIWTLDSKGELLLTIMSSLAQEESRSISENITWSKRKSAADGKVLIPFASFLGYDKGDDGSIVINEEQAVIVRRIYRDFIHGKTTWMIAQELTADGIPTPMGRDAWSVSTIESMLTNEKYKGAALLQKTFTVDFLSKKKKVNEGEIPQYYVENSHEAIIPPEEWERVQKEFARRRTLGRKYSGNGIFASRIICGDCGAFFGAKVWSSNIPKYRKIILQCNDKFKRGKEKCTTPHLTEEIIKEKFVEAFNTLFDSKDEIIANCKMVCDYLTDCTEIDRKRESLIEEMEIVSQLIRKLIQDNSTSAQDQTGYIEKYNGYTARYETANSELALLEQERLARQGRADAFMDFINAFKSTESKLLGFDTTLWLLTIDRVKVMNDGKLIFIFQSGTEITI